MWFDRQFEVAGMWEDIAMRLYITGGMASWLTMLPLAATSNQRAIRKLDFKNWQRLHRLIYVGALAGVIHYVWLVKSDIRKPLMYGGILLALNVGTVLPRIERLFNVKFLDKSVYYISELPSDLQRGDVITIALDRQVRIMKVAGFAERRGGAPQAAALYEDLTPEAPREPAEPPVAVREPGQGRPTKRDRRAWSRLTGEDI